VSARYTDRTRGIFYNRTGRFVPVAEVPADAKVYRFYVGKIGGRNDSMGTVVLYGPRNIKILDVVGAPNFDPEKSPTFASLAKAGSWLYANGGPA
jgi:hypothetical protein